MRRGFLVHCLSVMLLSRPASILTLSPRIVILRTAHMVSRPVVAGHLTALLRHPRAQLLYNNLYAALS